MHFPSSSSSVLSRSRVYLFLFSLFYGRLGPHHLAPQQRHLLQRVLHRAEYVLRHTPPLLHPHVLQRVHGQRAEEAGQAGTDHRLLK